MALVQKDLFNSPYAGVFCATNDNLTLVPPGIPEDDMKAMSEALGTELEIITLGGSRVLGTLIAMNNNGILVSNIVTDLELEKFTDISKNHKIDFGVLPDRSNAIGNNFLVNDRGGFSNERLGKRAKDKAEEILKINLVSQSINDMDTLGMIGCITNKGGICHPEISSSEKDKMREIFDIEIMEGTVNFGLPLVGAGIVANSNGAVCGRQSTGVELGRMEEALKLF